MRYPTRPFRWRRTRRGIFLTDTVVGLIIVVTLTMVLATMVWRHNQAGRKLSETRSALRLAERVLADLHAGNEPATIDPATGASVQVRALARKAESGGEWVEVKATVQGRSATLVGLVARGRLTKEVPR